MIKVVFLSEGSVRFFQIYGPPPLEWLESLDSAMLPLPSLRSSTGCIMVWTQDEAHELENVNFTALLMGASGLFDGLRAARRAEAFRRVLRLAQSTVDQSISVPALWRPFNAGSLISIQSSPRVKGERARVLFDRNKIGNISGISYGVLDEDIDLVTKHPERYSYADVQAELERCKAEITQAVQLPVYEGAFELEANNRALGLGESLNAWYESKLTATQRNFVDFPLSRSIRVRGPAGSGKTVALVIKVLRQLQIDRAAKRSVRYGLLTHSEATVELIRSMLRTMVSESELNELTKGGALLYVGTLYALAFEMLGTELRGLQPLSLDGRTGREMQGELLRSVIKKYLQTNWVARKGGCTSRFIELFEGCMDEQSPAGPFLFEILNEFACVLEPEGVSRSAQRRSDYINKTSRESWRLNLNNADERRVILDLHSDFRTQMKEMETISIDQLVADFDRFLDSNAWELTRDAIGFEATFIDELHLLNRLERMLITSLQRDAVARPTVVMAEDLKQDVRRVGLGLRVWQQNLNGLEDFDLNEVFRYTPQINSVLRAIDEFAPTLNLQEDWPNYEQTSNLPPGAIPDVCVFGNIRQQYDKVFPEAATAAKKRRSGRSVAVLCCDYESFKQYLSAGQHRDLFIPVESREDLTLIPSRGTRFVFSMPEFVAGLQFEEVFLIDVSKAVLANGEAVGVLDKRRGLSLVYLGASRAMSKLHISALADAGGLPSFIQHAVQSGACIMR